jgi:hypothetical protein
MITEFGKKEIFWGTEADSKSDKLIDLIGIVSEDVDITPEDMMACAEENLDSKLYFVTDSLDNNALFHMMISENGMKDLLNMKYMSDYFGIPSSVFQKFFGLDLESSYMDIPEDISEEEIHEYIEMDCCDLVNSMDDEEVYDHGARLLQELLASMPIEHTFNEWNFINRSQDPIELTIKGTKFYFVEV